MIPNKKRHCPPIPSPCHSPNDASKQQQPIKPHRTSRQISDDAILCTSCLLIPGVVLGVKSRTDLSCTSPHHPPAKVLQTGLSSSSCCNFIWTKQCAHLQHSLWNSPTPSTTTTTYTFSTHAYTNPVNNPAVAQTPEYPAAPTSSAPSNTVPV